MKREIHGDSVAVEREASDRANFDAAVGDGRSLAEPFPVHQESASTLDGPNGFVARDEDGGHDADGESDQREHASAHCLSDSCTHNAPFDAGGFSKAGGTAVSPFNLKGMTCDSYPGWNGFTPGRWQIHACVSQPPHALLSASPELTRSEAPR